MARGRQSKLNAQISEEAAEWFVEFRTGEVDAQSRAQFDAWVRSSPEHLRAYLEMAAIWNESSALTVPGTLGEAVGSTNVVELAGVAASQPTTDINKRSTGRRHSYAIAASLAAALVAAGTLVWYQVGRGETYTTGVGEQRSVRLDDGSIMELNSRSHIRVVFSEHERRVELVKGQALFQVAKDRARPFTVRSGGAQIRAVGTQFDVNRKRAATIVTVLEGRVAVSDTRVGSRADLPAVPITKRDESVQPPIPGRNELTRVDSVKTHSDRSEAALILGAGEQVTLSAQSVARPVRTNVSAVTAWTQNQIVLESARLSDVAEEFNRYSARLLVVEDHGHPELRLSGVFSTDPRFLIRYLRERPDITIRETQSKVHITRHE